MGLPSVSFCLRSRHHFFAKVKDASSWIVIWNGQRGTILAGISIIPSPQRGTMLAGIGIIPSPLESSCHKFFSSNQGRKMGSVVGYSTWVLDLYNWPILHKGKVDCGDNVMIILQTGTFLPTLAFRLIVPSSFLGEAQFYSPATFYSLFGRVRFRKLIVWSRLPRPVDNRVIYLDSAKSPWTVKGCYDSVNFITGNVLFWNLIYEFILRPLSVHRHSVRSVYKGHF